MKIEINTWAVMWTAIILGIARAVYVWAIMAYIWVIAGNASVYTGASYYSVKTNMVQNKCAGNYVYNYWNLTAWTPNSIAADKQAYGKCKALLLSKQDKAILEIESITK